MGVARPEALALLGKLEQEYEALKGNVSQPRSGGIR